MASSTVDDAGHAQQAVSKPSYPSSMVGFSLEKLFVFQIFWARWYDLLVFLVPPFFRDHVRHLIQYAPHCLFLLLIKKDSQSLWQWISENCGQRFQSKRFWMAVATSALFIAIPLIIDIMYSRAQVIIVLHSLPYYLLFLPAMIVLLAGQTFMEEYVWRGLLLRNKNPITIALSCFMFSMGHVYNTHVLQKGILPFFLTFSGVRYVIPALLFSVLEYSWGLHFFHNFCATFITGSRFSAIQILTAPSALLSHLSVPYGFLYHQVLLGLTAGAYELINPCAKTDAVSSQALANQGSHKQISSGLSRPVMGITSLLTM